MVGLQRILLSVLPLTLAASVFGLSPEDAAERFLEEERFLEMSYGKGGSAKSSGKGSSGKGSSGKGSGKGYYDMSMSMPGKGKGKGSSSKTSKSSKKSKKSSKKGKGADPPAGMYLKRLCVRVSLFAVF